MTLADGVEVLCSGILSKGCLSKLLLFWLFDRRKQALSGLFLYPLHFEVAGFSSTQSNIFEAKRKCGELTAESFLSLEVPSQPAFSVFMLV